MGTFSERQSEIIDASVRIIAERGIQELTIKNLSLHIGISEPALYRHFENKTAILSGILEFFRARGKEIFEGILRKEPAGEKQLLAVFREHCSKIAEEPAFSAVLFSEMLFQNEPRLAENVYSLMDTGRLYLTKIIENGIASGAFRKDLPLRNILIVVMGSLRLLVHRWHLTKYSFDLRAEGAALGETLYKMLKA